MKFLRYILPAALAAMACACESYEIDMPAEPEAPVTGPEVPSQVIYQANPRFFGSEECLKGVTAQIPRIASMGCDVLWVMPVCAPGQDDRSIGSPYCIRDFTALNSRYGTMADFDDMVRAAHEAGMKVILDWIANHTSWDHAWISEHPEYYVRDAAGNIQQASSWTDVAQLDYSNPALHTAMTDAMNFWLRAGVDGFRCDYAEGVAHEFWQSFISQARESNPDIIMIAESADASFYADGFDMIYDWSFGSALSDAFTGGKASDLFTKEASSWSKVPEGSSILRYALNHDVAAENSPSALYGSADAVAAAYVMAAMVNGTPMMYSSMDSGPARLSFFDYNPLTWSEELTAEYKAINEAFKASAEVRRGRLQTYADKDVAVFTRAIAGHRLLVMVNTTGGERTVKCPISLAGASMTDLIGGTATTVPVEMNIRPYGYVLLMD